MANGNGALAGAVERRREALEQLDTIESLAKILVSVLVGCAVLYSAGIAIAKSSPSEFLRVGFLFIALIVSGAVIGGLLGFLFGVPKLGGAAPADGADSAAANGAAGRSFFKGNTNLEEISDWLTKIIVGVGLVEAKDIYDGIGTLAVKFQTSVFTDATTAPAAGGQAAFLIFGLGAVVVGFLFMNLETRTRITLLFEDTESLRQGPTKDELAASIKAPIAQADLTSVPEQAAATAPKRPGDDAILNMDYNSMQTAEQFAAWGGAQARAGNLQAAVRALNEAISRDPSTVEYLLKLAEVRQGQGDGPGALVLLNEVRSKSKTPDPVLLKRVLLNALYLNPPDGFQTAIEILQDLEKIPKAIDDPSVQVWTAAAFGQQYRWLKQNLGAAAELAAARGKALAAAKRAVELSPAYDSGPRVFLRRVFNPALEKSPQNENDLEVFKDDDDFKAVVYQGKPPTA